ncbi:MAG: methylmalonyl-CoA epimerase [Acidimicrobiales bacterium]
MGHPPMFTDIDHVGLAVRDLDAAVAWYEATFGLKVAHRECMDLDGVEEALIPLGDSWIQLLTPTRADSPVARWLERRGEGLHHIAYRVADCALALQEAKRAGASVLDERPRAGSRGTVVAFLHPKGAFGTLIELVQE